MTKKWDEMNLTEKVKAHTQMRERFPDKGASPTYEKMALKLCEMDIPPNNDAIGGVIRGEIPIDKIKLSTPVKPKIGSEPRSTFGERSVPEAMRLSNEYNQSVSEAEQKSWHYFVYC